ncbi:glycosyltransferase family 4 protein [candidate division WS5 bacterium]|uniref:Glycosyltransferase family 4 protein n=1 Tax=candidate division WS5 bacterium TaxID=2093353 RepID=A0A419DB87_9BACT|nr:MAG: glycosyltransferase family 4 protein [candidate division WS5 bacterium]
MQELLNEKYDDISILFISSNYPSADRPYHGAFVQQIVKAIGRKGVKCAVISPVSIFSLRYGKYPPKISYEYIDDNKFVKVLRPKYISFSNKKLFIFNTKYITQKAYEHSLSLALSLLDFSPTIVYGHFLYESGAAAVRMGVRLGVPSIVAVGESSFWSVEPVGFHKATEDFSKVGGVVSVSSSIKRSLIKQLKIPEEKICVLPNGVDLSHFYPRNRNEMRRKYKFSPHKFIIAFVGHFNERKGPQRLLSAASDMENTGIIFIGDGSIPLESKNILFKGVLEHSKIPEILSAADIFVLPTLSEGSCNSIVEALACGLPVITSKGEFNDDIVDDEVSIRVDPKNIKEIKDAIMKLYNNNELREKMSANALRKIKKYDINNRSQKILDMMAELKKHSNFNKQISTALPVGTLIKKEK